MIDLVAKNYRQHLVRRVGNVVTSRAVALGIAPSHYVLLTIRGRRSGAERTGAQRTRSRIGGPAKGT